MTKLMNKFTGNDWAMPVKKKRWVPVTSLLEAFAVRTDWRFSVVNRLKHKTWQLAIDIP